MTMKMKTEKEIQEEAKRTRYELQKKEPMFTSGFLQGYYLALRWVQGKADSAYRKHP